MRNFPVRGRIAWGIAYALGLGGIVYLASEGWSYYQTPLRERPRHEDHWARKPGGSEGIVFGIAGASMMTLMLLYSVRKRVPALRRVGRLSSWLRGHIFLGVFGPALIVLHSSFKFQGLVAVSFWSMIAVVASGVIGRFLYAQVPRSAAGDELTLTEALALDRELGEELRRVFGLMPAQVAELEAAATADIGENQGLVAVLVRLPFSSLRLRLRLGRLRRRWPHVPSGLVARFAALARQKAMLRRRLRLWAQLRELFHYWHVAHKPFALLMYTFMVVHIAVVWMTGYARFSP